MKRLLLGGVMACSMPTQPPVAPTVIPTASTATATPASAEVPTALKPFEVGVQVARRSGGSIAENTVLKTNEDFAIRLRLSEESYVYVINVNAAKEVRRLRPNNVADARLSAGDHRIPEATTKWLYVKPPEGQERLIVVASRGPVSDIDKTLADIVGASPATPPEPVEAPPVATAKPASASRRSSPRPTRPIKPSFGESPQTSNNAAWVPDPARISALHPRGMTARTIEERDEAPQTITAADGLVVYVLTFSHKANP